MASIDELWKFQTELSHKVPVLPKPETKPPPKVEANGGQKKFKWATSLDTSFKFDFAHTIPVEDLSKVEWKGTKGIERSETGAEGVFFAETGNGSIVIKGSKSLAGEVFASLITMYFGIYAPKCRILKTESEEGAEMLTALKAVDPSWRVITNLFDLSYVVLKEFVHGVNLDSLSSERALEIFGEGGELSENGKKRLQELGTLIAIDMLLNNGDRIPIPVWGNQGNAGNVMFSLKEGVSMSVDSQIMAINHTVYQEESQQYLNKVNDFLIRVVSNDSDCQSDLTMARGMIQNFSKYDIGEKGISEIREGILKVVRASSAEESKDDFIQKLEKWKTLLVANDPPLIGIEKVDIEFIRSVWTVFQSHSVNLK